MRLVQNKMDSLRNYRLKLIIAKVLRVVRLLNGSKASIHFPDTFYPCINPALTKKIMVIDHSYHYKTASFTFLINLLAQTGSVRIIWDSQWNGGTFPSIARINQEEFDVLILLQIMIYHHPENLKKLNCKNIIIVPMYDDIHADPDLLFLRFKDFRFISFCRELQQRFDRLAIMSMHVQYFIDPSTLPYHQESYQELKGFFWQRTNDITWNHVRQLIAESCFSSFHLHLALDPIWYREVLPTEEEMKKYHITVTRWFDKKDEFLNIFSKANVFFTPRLYEGIGLPVIEAMSMGMVVVAPDHPTMNEYITHGENGLLYDVNNLKPLDFKQVKNMAAKARENCFTGFEKWQNAKPELLDFIMFDNTSKG